jgi:hypothetical protein
VVLVLPASQPEKPGEAQKAKQTFVEAVIVVPVGALVPDVLGLGTHRVKFTVVMSALDDNFQVSLLT